MIYSFVCSLFFCLLRFVHALLSHDGARRERRPVRRGVHDGLLRAHLIPLLPRGGAGAAAPHGPPHAAAERAQDAGALTRHADGNRHEAPPGGARRGGGQRGGEEDDRQSAGHAEQV